MIIYSFYKRETPVSNVGYLYGTIGKGIYFENEVIRTLNIEKEAAARAQEEKRIRAREEYLASQGKSTASTSTSTSTSTDDTSSKVVEETYESNLANFFGIEGFTILANGYTVTKSYPNNENEDILFAMDATEGNQFLVAKFLVTNTQAEASQIDMMHKKASFNVIINGVNSSNAQNTLLVDDLLTIKEEVAAQETLELVLVFEVKDEVVEELNSIVLKARFDGDTANMKIQ